MKVKLGVTRALSPVFETGTVDLTALLPVLEQHAAAMVDDAREGWPTRASAATRGMLTSPRQKPRS